MDRMKKLYTCCVFGAIFLLACVHSATGTLLTPIIQHYSLDSAAKGLPSGIVSGFAIAAFVISMLLSGRVRKTATFRFALLLGGIALCCILIDLPFWGFLCLMALVGLSTGLIDAMNSPIITELYPGSKSLMCALHGTYGVAGLIMPFIFKPLMTKWQLAFMLIGVIMLALLAVSLFVKRDMVETPPCQADCISAGMLREMLSVKELIPMYLSMLFGGMFINGMLMFASRFIEFGKGSAELSLIVVSVVYLAIAVSRLGMSFLNLDTYIYLKCALPIGVIALTAAVFISSPFAVLVLVFISTACYGPAIPCTLTLAAARLPRRSFMVTVSMMFVMMLGQTVYSPLYGAVETRIGSNYAMLVGAGMLLLAWLGVMFIKRNADKA